MSPRVERESNEGHITEDDEMMEEKSIYHHIGRNGNVKRSIRAQWFCEIVKGDIISIKRLLQVGADVDSEDYEKSTALHLAAKSGNTEVVNLLIKNGATVDIADNYSNTALHFAAMHGHKEVVDSLIKHGAGIDVQDNRSNTALHLAATNGHKGVVYLLLENGAAVDTPNNNLLTALHGAAGMGHYEVVDLLTRHGATVEATNNKIDTALHFAAMYGHKEVVSLLIKNGATVDIADKNSNTALQLAAISGHKEVIDLLMRNGATVDTKTKKLSTTLHFAAGHGHKEVVDLLLKNGATVDITDEDSNTALHWAAMKGHKAIVSLLIENGAAVDINNKNSEIALHLAARKGHKEVVGLLIKNDTAVDTNNKDLNTALHFAARNGHKEVVDLLIENGATVDIANKNLNTVLHLAAMHGHKEVVEKLIKCGAAVDAKDENLETALHFAARNGHKEVVNFLVENGATIDITDRISSYVLHWAAEKGHKEVVSLLIEHGVTFNVKNEDLNAVLHWAAMNGHKEAVYLLLQKGAAVDAPNENLLTVLQSAAAKGHKEVVELLIENGATVDSRCNSSHTALHWASKDGHIEVVDLLLKYGAAVDARGDNSETALHLAAMNGHKEVVVQLLKHGSNLEAISIAGQTPLMIAVQADQLNMVSLLIEKKANIEATDNTSFTSLHHSAEYGYLAVLELLLQNNANIEATTSHGDTALHLAAESDYVNIVSSLINHEANIEAKNEDGHTPIQVAMLEGHFDVVEQLEVAIQRKYGHSDSRLLYLAADIEQITVVKILLDVLGNNAERSCYINAMLHRALQHGKPRMISYLLDIGADIEQCNDDGHPPLSLAYQYPEVISMLLHRGANIDARNTKNRNHTILQYYSSIGHVAALLFLLNCGCNIHLTDDDKNTALHYATRSGQCEVVNILLQRGADINAKNDRGETALHIAVENNMIEVGNLLIDNGIDIDAKNDTKGSTALHIAIETRHSKLISLLLERHADVNSKDNEGSTALHLAVQDNLTDVCALIMKRGVNINSKNDFDETPLYLAVEEMNPYLVNEFFKNGASVNDSHGHDNLLKHAIRSADLQKGYNIERRFIAMIKVLVAAGVNTDEMEVLRELEKRCPTLRNELQKCSNQPLELKGSFAAVTAANVDDHREIASPMDVVLKEYRDTLISDIEANLGNERWMIHTSHKYGYGFPLFKILQLENFPDIGMKEDESTTSRAAPYAQSSKPSETISLEKRAIAIIRSLLDCVGARFFATKDFFMLEPDGCIDMMPPSWASHFDKMKGIIREPGCLIVQIPPKNTTLSVPTWYKSSNPYLQFIDAVYVCRRSSFRPSQDAFSDILGGSEQNLAVGLHALLIAGLSILSIAGGDELVEKLVMAICGVELDPIRNVLPSNSIFSSCHKRNRCRCPCNSESIHRPLSPVAAAKAVGMNVWRKRHPHIVKRVWDLKNDELVENKIDVTQVVFITHMWKIEFRYEDLIKLKPSQRKKISKMSDKLKRIYKTLRKRTRYVWMDTICIDKSNLTELDEAIRSMYKWYANSAAVVLDSGTSLSEWSSRGWCLQEGAAAGILCGISKDGKLATIQELAIEQNQDLCTLDLHLYYRRGNAAEILARMDARQITREEDRAYALIGLFSIDLAAAYGEGLRSRARLMHQLAIQKGDLSFLSFHTAEETLHHYLPAIDETKYLIAKCTRASAPVTVSHFGICFEVQFAKGEIAKRVMQNLSDWINMSFAKGRSVGAEVLIKAGEQSEDENSSAVELAIVHDIRSLILVRVYGQDMQSGGGNPIKLCYRYQCCQIEELEFKRLFPKDGIKLERIWLGDEPESDEQD